MTAHPVRPRCSISWTITVLCLVHVAVAGGDVVMSAPGPKMAQAGAAPSEPGASPDSELAEADAAFDRGEHDRALSLYMSALRSNPGDLQALRRAGLLLGWAGRAEEAVPLLEKAVRLEPGDLATRRQLARVYSWSGQYGPSLRLYGALVTENPADTSAAIERARVLGWSGQLASSERTYREILEKEPSSTEAALGLAQCLGWEGRVDEAESLYRGVLDKDPAPARLGLGRVSLWRGDAGGALRAARAELAQDPKNTDARDLERAALARLKPSLGLASEISDDTDDNRTLTGSATVSFHPGGAVDLDVTGAYLRAEGTDQEADRLEGLRLDDRNGDGTLDPLRRTGRLHSVSSSSLALAVGFAAGSRGRVTVGAAAERLGSFARPEELEDRGSETALSALIAVRVLTGPVTTRISVAREIPKWTAFVTQRNLRWDHVVAGIEGTRPWSLSWAASVDGGRISEGTADNARRSALARVWRPFPLGGPTLTARYAFRFLSYERNLNDGYFDPQHYVSSIVGLDLGGRLAAGRFGWTIGADAGLEKFHHEEEDDSLCDVLQDPAGRDACRTRAPAADPRSRIRQGRSETGHNTVLGYSGRLSWNLSEDVSLEAYAFRIESAAQTATGFTTRTFGVTARIVF